MKNIKLTFLLIILMSMFSSNLFAQFAHSVSNGKTIYYQLIKNKTELSVTIKDGSDKDPNRYSGEIVIPESAYIKSYKEGKTFYFFHKTLPVTSIHHGAFQDCNGLTSVTIPNSVTEIGSDAFRRCTGLTSISIGNSVTSIGNEAFKGCTGLTSITIPDSVTSIGIGAFKGCTGLTSITIGNSVTKIGDRAFEGCTGLTSITIGNSVTKIGDRAFEGCTRLTSITIPNSVTEIGGNAFKSCSALTTMTIGNHVSIEYQPFEGCFKLKRFNRIIDNFSLWCEKDCISDYWPIYYGDYEVYLYSDYDKEITNYKIPDNVTSIRLSAFKNCKNLEKVSIPNSVSTISDNAFFGCTGLSSVSMNMGLISIGERAFENCRNLTSITIPNSVNYIGSSAFYQCSNLTSVIIPSSVTTIGYRAFYFCKNLTSVTIKREQPIEISWDTFDEKSMRKATLYVPKGCKNTYEAAGFWGAFKEIVEVDMVSTHKLIYVVDGVEYKTYDIEEGATVTPEQAPTKKGFTFSGWSEIPETMPDHDVTVTGTFTKNSTAKYKLIYMVDGEVYKTYEIEEGATITPEAAPTKEGFTFSGWSEIPKTMPDHDVTATGTFTKNPEMLNDHYVDLGLPSGLLWATHNLGASSPEEVGGYYAWGETSPKTYFSRDNYKYKNNTLNISNISGTEYDAATTTLGGTWRMPTKEELEELANKCTRTETTLNGKACMMFTGPNGNSLYLPKGGFGDEGNGAGLNGYGLWSSTGSGSYAYRAWEWTYISYSWMWQGIPIRPVTSVKPYIVGDANGDNMVNAADIVEVVNAMNGKASTKFILSNVDSNNNGKADADDIKAIVNIIMNSNK